VTRVQVRPELLRWARERSERGTHALATRFPRLAAWEAGDASPTLKQLEAFARATCVPIGFLFLAEPPQESVPIPDLRTIASEPLGRPSPDLLDTIYLCQRRQSWYRDWARSVGGDPRPFVGSASIDSPPEKVAAAMREALGFDLEARRTCPTWTEALRQFAAQADDLGVLVMVSGVVGSNNRRKLDPDEFRGFALADDLAPLVFVNGSDTKAAQMFTLAHELAHLWLGKSALSDAGPASAPSDRVESWCNRVAAELLVPMDVLRREVTAGTVPPDAQSLARRFKVSTLVILRRLLDLGRLTRQEFVRAYESELERLRSLPRTSGGDFYLTQPVRLSRRFARALVVSTLEGQTLYRDAFRMLGISKAETFQQLSERVLTPA
jgi:Zn-dependent peptidase ImmA (M78 family)